MDYQQGKAYLDQGQTDKARQTFEKGYLAGDIRCAYGLLAAAAMSGQPRDAALAELEKVLPQLRQAAENADADALFILGRCAETGSVMEENIAQAIGYYQKAASAGNTDAMYNLGCIYMHTGEIGVKLALDWYELAAKQGHAAAEAALRYWKQTQP